MPPKSSPNELALTITRYRKSKLSSLVEKFTRRSPSSWPPDPGIQSSYGASFLFPRSAQFTELILIFGAQCVHTNVSCRRVQQPPTGRKQTPCSPTCVYTHVYVFLRMCAGVRTSVYVYVENGYREEKARYERTTPFSYSPSCVRAYSLSVLGQVFTLASIQRQRVLPQTDTDYRSASFPKIGTSVACAVKNRRIGSPGI